jgi:hypothetical protein
MDICVGFEIYTQKFIERIYFPLDARDIYETVKRNYTLIIQYSDII